MNELTKRAKAIQALASSQLYADTAPLYTDVEEWKEIQLQLATELAELEKLHGNTPEEEGEIVLAILMGYCIAVRNGKKVMQALQRAGQVIHQLDDELLKCKLAVHCYMEVPDEELQNMTSSLIEKLRQQGKENEIQPLESLMEQFIK